MNYNSFYDYLKSLPEDTIFRIWQRKFIFTPYEESMAFSDESVYQNEVCEKIRIKDLITLPNNDTLIAACWEDDDSYITYYKLSEIDIAKSDKDMEEDECL